MVSGPVVNVYPLSSYTFGSKEAKMEKDTSVADRLARMKQNYMKEGMRTSVEGILLGVTVTVMLVFSFITAAVHADLVKYEIVNNSAGYDIVHNCVDVGSQASIVIVSAGTSYDFQSQVDSCSVDWFTGDSGNPWFGCSLTVPLSSLQWALTGDSSYTVIIDDHGIDTFQDWPSNCTGTQSSSCASSPNRKYFFKLPGGRLKTGENEIEGLKRKLTSKLAPTASSIQPDWQIGECAGVWWRPNFETLLYPYCPPHITKPKECKKLFVVPLAERQYFAVPKNLKLLAVPLFELYDNVQRYGPVISAIPQQLSRFNFNAINN